MSGDSLHRGSASTTDPKLLPENVRAMLHKTTLAAAREALAEVTRAGFLDGFDLSNPGEQFERAFLAAKGRSTGDWAKIICRYAGAPPADWYEFRDEIDELVGECGRDRAFQNLLRVFRAEFDAIERLWPGRSLFDAWRRFGAQLGAEHFAGVWTP